MSATRSLLLASALLTSMLLGGCLNDCQELCNEMADYWEECNLSFGDSEPADCRESYEDEELFAKYEGACRTLMANAVDSSGATTTFLRAEYTCEMMREGPGGAFGGGAR